MNSSLFFRKLFSFVALFVWVLWLLLQGNLPDVLTYLVYAITILGYFIAESIPIKKWLLVLVGLSPFIELVWWRIFGLDILSYFGSSNPAPFAIGGLGGWIVFLAVIPCFMIFFDRFILGREKF